MVPDEIREIFSINKPDVEDVRWVKPEKYHITFEYFAELPTELMQDVFRKVQALSEYFPLQCEAKCFSGFPSYRKARVIIVHLELASAELATVCDNRRFKPHVTLGYARNRSVSVPQSRLQHFFAFDRPALYRSQQGVYTEIRGEEV